MKHLRFILYIVLAFASNNAFSQMHIYDRYASRTDLEVAYLKDFPLDSTMSINATIIIANDSTAWETLKREFNISDSFFPELNCSKKEMLRDKNDPTSLTHKNVVDCYYVVVNYQRKSITIFQYDNIDQYHLLIHFSTKNIIYEKK